MSAPETLPEVQAPEAAPDFAPQHEEYLRERAVPLDLARAAGLCSVTGEEAARQLGRRLPIVGGGLSISYSGHKPPMFRIRLDLPEVNGGARYLSPAGREVPIYIPSVAVPTVMATGPAAVPFPDASAQPSGDESTPASLAVPTQLSSVLVVVESAIKALAVLAAGVPAVGLGGVATTLVMTKSGERRLNDSWQGVAVRGRTVIIVMDAGRASNPEVARAEARLAQALARAGAQVRVAALPLNDNGEDQGPDDFLAARGPQALWTVLTAAAPADPVVRATEVAALKDSKATAALLDELPFLAAVTEASPGQQRLVEEQMRKMGVKAREWNKVLSGAGERLKASGPSERQAHIGETEYAVENGQLSIITYGKNDERHAKALCNFNAKVLEETAIDDGVEERRQLVLSGRLANGVVLPKATLEMRNFSDPLWAQNLWGVKVQTSAESFTNAHLRLAIQQQSEPVQRRVYAHTGWKHLRDEAGDVSGLPVFLHSGGAIGSQDVTVVLDGALARYRLPDTVEDVVDAVRTSLNLLDIAPRVLTIPLLAATFRAPLQSVLYADFSVCPTGRSGSQKTTVSNLFAAHFGEELVERSAINWSDTAASIESKLFAAQDCLVVVDDFAPKAGSSHDSLHAKAEVILRSIGNGASRGRMRADMTARPDRPPRALVISTGEDAPSGESIRARTVPLHFKQGVVDLERLSQAQARVGRLPHAMAAYLEWLRAHMEDLPARLRERFVFWRDHFRTESCHLRAPAALAHLTLGLELLGDFARDAGALNAKTAKRFVDDGVAVLSTLGAEQSRNVGEMDPVLRFIEVLQSLLSQGKVTLEPILKNPLIQDKASPGVPIGWLAGNEVYLLKEAVFSAVVSALRAMGENFPLAQMTLWRRLRDMGKLRAGTRDGHLTQRKSVGPSGRTEVLVMPLDVLFPDDGPDGGGDGGGTPLPTGEPGEELPMSDHLDLSVEDGPAWSSHLTSSPSADMGVLESSGLAAGEARPGRRALPASADASGPPVDSNRTSSGPNRTISGEEEVREVLETPPPPPSTPAPVVRLVRLVRFPGGDDSPMGVDSGQAAAGAGREGAKKCSSSSALSPGTSGPTGPLEAKPWISHGSLVGQVPGANRTPDLAGPDQAHVPVVSVAGPAVVALALHTAGSGGRLELKYALPGGKTGLLDASSAAMLAKATVLAHDAKPVLARLASRFDVSPHAVRCTATAARLLAGDGKAAPTLEQAVLAHMPNASRPSIFHLDEVLAEKLKDAELTRVADLEYALVPVLVEMEATGVGMDEAAWLALVTVRQQEADALHLRVRTALGVKNPDHDAEVLAALRARGLPVERTARAVLAPHAGLPFVADFLRYRQLMAFVRDAGKHVVEALAQSSDGRVRASFDALASPTGRMGCSTPNLLGLPKEADIRRCIVPAPGSRLVVADYRAIDLRVLADVTGDAALRAVFHSGGDPHRQTAALLLGKVQPDVIEEERRRAKPVNFGFAFGMGEPRFIEYALADYGLAFTLAEARKFKASYLAGYPGVADWQARVRRGKAREVRSASGRRRYFPPGTDSYTQQLSTEVQGTAADGMKRAMVLLHSRLPALNARMVLPVHDELLVEAPEETAVEVKSMVVAAMREGMGEFVTSVPIEVDSSVRATWADET